MKIPLNMGQNGNQSGKAAQAKVLAQDIKGAKKGNWNSKNNLTRTFTPLLTSLAEKRASDVSEVNDYIEAGKKGLFKATRKYKDTIGPERFQIFALDFIEKSMDSANGSSGGFFAKLFGG